MYFLYVHRMHLFMSTPGVSAAHKIMSYYTKDKLAENQLTYQYNFPWKEIRVQERNKLQNNMQRRHDQSFRVCRGSSQIWSECLL